MIAGNQRVLAFRHVPFEGAGYLESVLQARGIQLDYADLYLPGSQMPDLDAYDGLIFLGGPMSVNDDLPFVDLEIRAILKAVTRSQPVLGICLGSQLIAKAFGARVYRNAEKEIGWFDVKFTPAAADDPLFASLPETQSLFHWHGETFELPPHASLLASSERCLNQAFRIGSTTYGLQFHLEVTPAMISDWCAQDANSADVQELDGPLDERRDSTEMRDLADIVFGRWCALLGSSHNAKFPG